MLVHIFRQQVDGGRDVPHHPVHPRARRCIGIVHDQGEAGGLDGLAAPREGRRHVGSLAGVRIGEDGSGGEYRTGKSESHGRLTPFRLVRRLRCECGGEEKSEESERCSAHAAIVGLVAATTNQENMLLKNRAACR